MQTTFLATSKQWREAWQRNWADADLERVKVAVAYCSRNGVAEIERAQRSSHVPLQLLVGLNDGVTDVFAREALFDWAQKRSEVEVHGEFHTRGRFHPKVYIFELKNEMRILVGSVNLTKSAFSDNTEAALEWVVPGTSPEATSILSTFQSWWEGAPSLERPGEVTSEVARLGVEERLVATMREGVLVDIEVDFPRYSGRKDKRNLPKEKLWEYNVNTTRASSNRKRFVWSQNRG